MKNIKKAKAIYRGNYHVLMDIPCQDKVKTFETLDVCAMSLCDGAGSSLYSQIGAEVVSDWCSEYLCEHFSDMTEMITHNSDMAKTKFISDAQEQFYSDESMEGMFCCTLLSVAINTEGQWIAIHIGDGVIFGKEEKTYVLSAPENGEYKNETFFVNGTDAEEHLRVYVGQLTDTGSFLLSSDGCSEALWDENNDTIAEAVRIMMEWGEQYDEDEVSEALKQSLEGLFCKKSDDDLSIGILSFSK